MGELPPGALSAKTGLLQQFRIKTPENKNNNKISLATDLHSVIV
jgi:hypothetical protein